MADSTTAESIEQTAAELGLSMTAEFVPWSQSRNKGEKQPSLNWKIKLAKNGRDFLTTDYMQGNGYCQAYKAEAKELGDRDSLMRAEAIKLECETGKLYRVWPGGGVGVSDKRTPPPRLADVLYSLASDADAIDAGGFEQWAGDLGYDTDSRKAEAIYRQCLETALKLRSALGESGLAKLREAVRDY